jgi:heme exporter protein D
MLPVFDDNAAFIWTIYAIGLVVPVLLVVYCAVRVRCARRRLEHLQKESRT